MSSHISKKGYVSDERVYEEMSRLNNQLSDMHRELSQKNAELERLKVRLEHMVEERTADLRQEIIKHEQTEKKLRKALKEIEQLKEQVESDYTYLREELKLEHNFEEIIGQSDPLKYVLFKIEQVATTDATVLLLGETGTGKELIARAIHSRSTRKDRPLVKLDCATLAPNLMRRVHLPVLKKDRLVDLNLQTGLLFFSMRLVNYRWHYR
jgi:transcriptional regulator with PAS, ATPase and Fis domain